AGDLDRVALGVPDVEGLRLLEPRRAIAGDRERDAQALVRERALRVLRLEEHGADGELADVALAVPSRVLHRVEQADEERRAEHALVLRHRVLEPDGRRRRAERLEDAARREAERDRLGEADRRADLLRAARELLAAADVARRTDPR